jgi:glycosyltransferase involved in cell wall biosynthesis
MHIGLYHEPLHTTDHRSYDTYGSYARYVLEFARHFENVTVFAPVTDQPTYFSGVSIDRPNITVAPLPFFMTHAQAYRRARQLLRTFRNHAADLDVVNARGTAPLAYLLWWLTRHRRIPFIYHFASDPFELIERSPKYRGLRGLFARTAYGLEFAIQRYIVRRNFGFASGETLCRRLRKVTANVDPVVDSSLAAEDYFQRDDCCTGTPIRLLYVGYLREGKGLNDLIDALAILRRENHDVCLDLVGDGELRATLQAQAERLGLTAHVHFRGYKQLGPEMNEMYKQADIFTLPSLSEGSPRVIIEALGHSLPVVATPVGNIPQQLDDGQRGVLVPINDPEALAQGILRIVNDADLRRECIRAGFAFAREHGMQRFVEQIAAKARDMIAQRRTGTPTC